MPPGLSGSSHRYEVRCHGCQAPFDALQAAWCVCVAKERSLVCPSCHTCFCKAPRSYKQRFWTEAPPSLWEAKLSEHRPVSSPALPVDPALLTRPLIVVVDDEKEVQRVAVRAIQALGYSVLLARDGQEGLDLVRRYQPDLVLTDAMMPNLDGRELCKRIKADAVLGNTKVIIMTSLYTAARYKYEALGEFKADDYLTKPIELSQLRAVLQKHLGG